MRELSCMEASQLEVQAVLANVPSAAWLTTVSRQSFVVDGDVAAAAKALRGAVRDLQASPAVRLDVRLEATRELRPLERRTIEPLARLRRLL